MLFLDEPTTGLDPEARAAMWDEIGRLAGDEELAILLTTHYLDEADRLAARLAIVDRGRIVVEGTPDQLKGELRGDAVHIELREPADERAVRRALDALPGVRDVAVDGRLLRARADDGAATVPAALAALDDARRRGGHGDRRPAVARRRLPAARRPPVRGSGGRVMTRRRCRTPGG